MLLSARHTLFTPFYMYSCGLIHRRYLMTISDGMGDWTFQTCILYEIMTVNIVTIYSYYLYLLINAVYRITIVLLFPHTFPIYLRLSLCEIFFLYIRVEKTKLPFTNLQAIFFCNRKIHLHFAEYPTYVKSVETQLKNDRCEYSEKPFYTVHVWFKSFNSLYTL